MAGKSMLEQVSAVKRERREYREYIEQWIHEIKTPLTALKLLCDNNKSEITRTMLLELERLNSFLRGRHFIMPAVKPWRRII